MMIIRCFALILLMVWSAPSCAQSGHFYQIELLVFDQGRQAVSEQGVALPLMFAKNHVAILSPDEPAFSTQMIQHADQQKQTLLLPHSLFHMNQQAKQLQVYGHDIIAHFAWRTDLLANGPSRSFALDTNTWHEAWANHDQDISGFIGLSQGRFIDLQIHWILKTQQQSNADDWEYIIESRRLKPGIVNYIDHPLVGVLALAQELS